MSDDSVFIRKAIADSTTARLKIERDRLEKEKKQTPQSFYAGQDESGNALARPVAGSAAPLRLIGNVQPSMGSVGRGSGGAFDPGSQTNKQVSTPRISNPDVKILARGTSGGRIRFYLGGDRPTAEEIFSLPINRFIVSAKLENLGKGKNEWIVAIKSALSSDLNTYQIDTIFGDGRAAWSIAGKKTSALQYIGNGFWSAIAKPFPVIDYETSLGGNDTPATPVIGSFRVIPPVYANRNTNASTAAGYAFQGDRSQTTTATGTYSGLRGQTNAAWDFTGTNSKIAIVSRRAAINGDWVGAGVLPESNSSCTVPSPSASGTATYNARTQTEATSQFTRTLATQFPSFWATEGNLSVETGQYSISGNGASTTGIADTPAASAASITVTQACERVGSVTGAEFELYNSYFTVTPAPPAGQLTPASQSSNIALSINTDFFIAPGVSKTYAVESNLLATPNGNATINQSIPFTAFKQSCLYQRFLGFATIDARLDAGLLSYVVLPPRTWVWRSPSGAETQITPVSFPSESWRQSPDPEIPPILRWLKVAEGEQVNSALTQKLNWTVNSRAGVDYTQDTNDKTKRVKTYALNLPTTVANASVIDAR